MSQPPKEHIDRKDVQGNLVGFNKDHQRFVFLSFPDQASGRALLSDICKDIATASEVLRFNQLFKEISERGGAEGTVEAAWTNICLSFSGLEKLGASGLESFPQEFRDGMRQRAELIGDNDDSSPPNWVSPFNQTIDAMAILAADSPEDLEDLSARLRQRLQTCGVVELEPAVDGDVRPGADRGHEHFGFKDGISQPSIRKLTHSSKGGDVVATGEFLIGYLDQDGHISGPADGTVPSAPNYSPSPAPASLPEWAKNGSFVVFRRLRQNVQAFNDFAATNAGATGGGSELLGAKLVGRYASGAPLERTLNDPPDFDPTQADPSLSDRSILGDSKINNFDYEPQDTDGHFVPRAAHIRKSYPRNENPPGDDESERHRILRRGIPYGPEFQPGEPPYPGQGQVPDDQDRGLVFVCYQSSIGRGFEFVQSRWVNKDDFPELGDGRDPIISQDVAERQFRLGPDDTRLSMQRWVTTTGGEYFFSPSITAIRELSGSGELDAGAST